MNVQYFITCVAILALGGIITFSVAYYFVKNDIQRYFNLKSFEARQAERAQLLPLRLQAHERLIVFIERLNPPNLFLRLHQQGISAAALQSLILNEIRSEYQHNVTQQLYISNQSWDVLRKLKDDTIAMVNNATSGLPADSSGIELSKKVLQHMASIGDNPYDLTLDLIKEDIHQLF